MSDRPSRAELAVAFAHWRAALERGCEPADAVQDALARWLDDHDADRRLAGELYDALCGLVLRDGSPTVDLASRRASGVTATPPALAAAMVNHALNVYRARHFKAPTRALEPACGLAPFAGALCDAVSEIEVQGCDVDARAVALARRLHPSAAFAVGDALTSDLADFDLVVMNPPYAFGEHKPDGPNLRSFAVDTGSQPDAWHYFVEAMVTRWLAPGGVYALVVPDSLLVRETTATVRDVLLTHAPPAIISHVGSVFRRPVMRGVQLHTEPAGVSAVVIIGQRGPARELVAVAPAAALGENVLPRPTSLPLAPMLADPQRRLFIHTPPPAAELVQAAVNPPARVADLLDPLRPIGRGVEAGKQALNIEPKPDGSDIPAIAGEHVERYRVVAARYYVDRASVPKEKLSICEPPDDGARVVLVRKTDSRLIAAFAPASWSRADHGEVCLQSVYVLRPRDVHAANVLYAWLNSRLAGFLLSATVTAYKRVLPQVTQRELLSLAAPVADAVDRDALAALVGMVCDASAEPTTTLLDAVEDLLIPATGLPLATVRDLPAT